ncbi:CHAT domain-containing protein [Aetokthonos hydrillicola Thurmond2011]|jgi:CHAT domain-containing protein/predicted LPLAT superfamily acyltransferase|uniref:CHAT domain-containing protein n=1 Tax=Aetokthonos hydrillicola Thurmond2011 TaxID=2712845 RepID=A0AAP5MA55_9CYAN|nr:CHAT domain-containing protein [Aetokthonos hydrillicola]MDR9895473.1 CHAT domain-containing protein [Aetokthonos hydrillicola Thurmond2011]
MNEQRQQAYLNLIRSLLDAPNGEVPKILAAHQDLLDAGLVQKVEEVAQMCSQHGDEKTANRLQNLAMQLGEALNLDTQIDLQSLSKEEIQAYIRFLIQVLQATENSKGNPEIVYFLLAQNIDKLDGVFAEILRRCATNRREAKAHEVEDLAAIIGKFSNLIQQFPSGDKASNIEIAITGYEVALTVYTKKAFRVDWAATQNNLAAAYWGRIKGDRAENIENAIAAYTAALTVRTREALPVDWAATQNNLAVAYWGRIKGDRAENIENAIAAYTAALTVLTRQDLPVDWAATQNNLANAYSKRIKGDRAENIENAIKAYTAALTVYTREALPVDWAMTQNNLAAAYWGTIKGDRAENIENAIAAYTAALTVRTREALPVDWAATQNNLAAAYSDRIRGDKAENIEKAIAASQAALTVYTKEALPVDWAATQNNLANAYSKRIKGDRAENIEYAITASTAALTVYTREALPVDWAATQNNLANAYSKRIKGDRAENIEKAITAYTAALTVYTREALPIDWAMTQNNLALAYRDTIKGDKAENIENAIKAYTAALTVLTREALPVDWAATQNNLAAAYRERIKGDKAENIEYAITASTAALTVRTREALPVDWAATQNNLANAYSDRIKADRAENIENAIKAYTAALTVYTREALPQNWAATQNNLAVAYSNKIKGDRAENIENAIKAYTAALTVYTREALPQNWAMTQNNLALAYSNKIKGDRAENIENAIKAYTEALTVYTREALPIDWAMTQNNLALAYSNKIKGDKAENIEMAIAAFTDALTVRTREALPVDWATTQNNLANAYSKRIKGDRAENIENAIKAYTAALTVYTREALPQNWAETLFNRGITYQDANQFDLAYNDFKSAIDTVESLREEIVSGEESKRKQAEKFNQVYSRMVEVCLQLNKITEAIEYAERSKTRNLVEQILERDSKTIFPPDVVTRLETYRDEIAAGQYQIQNGKADNPEVLAKDLQELRRQRNELQNCYLPVGYGFDFNSFQATLNENTVIIEWYILNDKILAFIVTKTGEVTVWQSQAEDREALGNWGSQYLQNYYGQKDEWPNSLESAVQQLAAILHIDEILTRIPQQCNQLILIPHRFLHLLPLHALPVNQNAASYSSLLDLFPHGVSYAPSCQLLQQVQQRKRPDFQSLFAVQNPTGDLNYTDLEVQVIQSYFNPANILKKTDATLTAINQSELNTYHCAHFSCHGSFNLTNASQSGLILANAAVEDTATKHDLERYLNVRAGETHDLDKCLTLDKIFALKLEKCRLVTLSACETGLIDFQNTSDEYIGLPSGFLLAGSSSVVSSLWRVNDLSTSFLMIKFYENLFRLDNLEAGDVAIALKEAQTWLRNLTVEEVVKFWEDKKILAQLRKGQVLIFEESLKRIKQRQHLPFANPYYWAGFIASGH